MPIRQGRIGTEFCNVQLNWNWTKSKALSSRNGA